MKRTYIVLIALMATASMRAMHEPGNNNNNRNNLQSATIAEAEIQQAVQQQIAIKTNDDTVITIPGHLVHYFKTLADLAKDTSEDHAPVSLPISRAALTQSLKYLQLIEDTKQRGKSEKEAEALVVKKAKEVKEQDPMSALQMRSAAPFLQSDVLENLYNTILPSTLISDASMQLLQAGNAEYIQLINALPSGIKDEIPHNIFAPSGVSLVHKYRVESSVFSPDRTKVVTVSQDGVRLWDVKTGQCLHTFVHRLGATSAAFSPNGTMMVTASWDRTAKIWDVKTGKCLKTLDEGHYDAIKSASFSPDGATIVTTSDSRTNIWDLATGTITYTFDHYDRLKRSDLHVISAKFEAGFIKIEFDAFAIGWDFVSDHHRKLIYGPEWLSHNDTSFNEMVDMRSIQSMSGDIKGELIVKSDAHPELVEIWSPIPMRNIDQALFAHLLAWAQRNGHPTPWQSRWAGEIMDTYSPEEKASIKTAFPKATIMQRISSYFYGSSSNSSNNNNNNNN